jgi:hypothetical protein
VRVWIYKQAERYSTTVYVYIQMLNMLPASFEQEQLFHWELRRAGMHNSSVTKVTATLSRIGG